MLTEDQRREVLRILDEEDLPHLFTGQTTLHWHLGEPQFADVLKRGRRKGDVDGAPRTAKIGET